jgi:hypothetical protein
MTHVSPAHVGRFEIRTVCEGFAALPTAEEFPELRVDWAAERRAYPWAYHGQDAWAWHVHAFVVETPEATVVVDTGAGPFGPYRPWEHWNADAWAKEDLADISHVALTHLMRTTRAGSRRRSSSRGSRTRPTTCIPRPPSLRGRA